MNILDHFAVPDGVPAFALLTALSGAALCALALVAGRLVRRRSLPCRYGVLFGGVIGLLATPVLVAIGQSLDGLFAVTHLETVIVPAERLDEILTRPAPAAPTPAPLEADSTRSDWTGFAGLGLISVWAAGMALGLGRLVRGLWKYRRAMAGEPWQAEWWNDERRHWLADKVGLKTFPAVWRSPLAPLPMVVGLWRPRIVIPEAAPASWSQPQWEAVLLHEAAHIARRDPWAALAQRLAGVLFWWCPLTPLLGRRLNDLRETICDDYALSASCDRLAYAALLVESAERLVDLRTLPIPVGLLDSARGGLEERITCLLEKEKRPMTKLSVAGKLLGAFVLTAACLAISAASAFSQAPPAQKKIQIKIVVDGKEIELTDEVLQALLAAKQSTRAPVNPEVHFTMKLAPDPRIEDLVKQA
jgi:beta-lactamase regulating signal transducer with metallopeptidase domain